MPTRTGLYVALLLSMVSSLRAQDQGADLSAWLQAIPAKHGVPAVGGALIHGFRLHGTGVAGVRRRGKGKKVAVTRSDRWHLGSCTKAMTATLLARLVERGKLRWDQKVVAVFPKVSSHADLKDITVLDLLGHRAGLVRDPTLPGLWKLLVGQRQPPRAARMTVVGQVLPRKPSFEPRKDSNYSNTGYMVAGAVAEALLDTTWEKLIQAEVFGPLGMKSAGFGAPGMPKPDMVNHLTQPWGHTQASVPIPPSRRADNPPAMGPAGTVHASLADWAKFIAVHLRDIPPAKAASEKDHEHKPFLKLETLRFLHEPTDPKKSYALGWGITRRAWAGGRTLNHNGTNTMWYAVCWLAPKKGIALLATCNQGGPKGAAACDAACTAMLQQIQKKTPKKARKKQP